MDTMQIFKEMNIKTPTLTVAQVAKVLDLSTDRIRVLIRKDRFKAHRAKKGNRKNGCDYAISTDYLKYWIKKHR